MDEIVESSSVGVELDNNSIDIIRKVGKVHRNSLINIGIALVSKTAYYRTLLGDVPDEVTEVSSLDIEQNETKVEKKTPKTEPKKVNTSWDSF